MRRDQTISDLASLREKIEGLKDAHRRGDRRGAFVGYRDVRTGLVSIELRHPDLTDALREQIRDALSAITEMERYTDSIDGALPLERVSEFNQTLSILDTGLITELQKTIPQVS